MMMCTGNSTSRPKQTARMRIVLFCFCSSSYTKFAVTTGAAGANCAALLSLRTSFEAVAVETTTEASAFTKGDGTSSSIVTYGDDDEEAEPGL